MNKAHAKREKTSVSLLPDAIRLIKKAAYERDEQFNEIIEQAVFALWSDSSAYPERATPAPVPQGHTPIHELGLISVNPSQLSELRETLNRAIAVIDGVLTDGQSNADTLGEIETKFARLVADSGDLGGDSSLHPPSRVTKPKARRGH